MILAFTGNGKGKTSSAVGLALRAFGHGKKVLFVSFLKSSFKSGEFKAIKKLNSTDLALLCFGRDCPYKDEDCCPGKCECIVLPANIKTSDYDIIKKGLDFVRKQIRTGIWDIVILDEIINVYNLFPPFRENILDIVKNMPPAYDLIVTGRECPSELLDLADLVSEIKIIKHPYYEGVKAKKGIDF